MIPRAEQDRRDRDVQLVNETGPEELARRARASPNSHIFPAGDSGGLCKHLLRSQFHEVERRATGHLDRRALSMGQYEHRHAKRRLVTPPALPIWVVGEGVEAEHPGTHDFGADLFEVGRGVLVVDAGRALTRGVVENPLAERARGGVGRSQLVPVVPEWVLRRAAFGSGVTVQRDVEVDSYSHDSPLLSQ